MNELVQHDEQLSSVEKRGQKLYKSNPNYRNIATVMEHPEFRNFYDTYMSDLFTTKTILMFLKLYEMIEEHSSVELTPYQKITILHEIMNSKEMRSKTIDCMQNWSNNLLIKSPSSDTIRRCIYSSIDSIY